MQIWTDRTLVWFSCGVASAVAAKIAIKKATLPVEVLYCDTLKYEHPDNMRFLEQVQEWIGQEIKVLMSSRYADIMAVFQGERFLRAEGITKADCYRILTQAGIGLPAMYRLGYRNNNCIGCVKGGAGYWNKIRRDFPEAFDRMAALERDLDHALNRLKKSPVFLDKLPKDAGRFEDENIECGTLCVMEEVYS